MRKRNVRKYGYRDEMDLKRERNRKYKMQGNRLDLNCYLRVHFIIIHQTVHVYWKKQNKTKKEKQKVLKTKKKRRN